MKTFITSTALVISFIIVNISAGQIANQDESKTAEEVVRQIYDLVTFRAGERPDWEKVKSLFDESAVVVLRTSRTQHSIFTVDGFVQDFVNFIVQAKCDETGFTEKVVNVKSVVFNDIAHCFVVYEAHIPGRPNPPQQGLDSFQLIKKDGEWKIISIINELPKRGESMPEYFLNQ